MNPMQVVGPWDEGYVLDKYVVSSEYIGEDVFGHPAFNTTYTEIGKLLHSMKYNGHLDTSERIWEHCSLFLKRWIDGKDIDLSFKEFELLSYFVENAGLALSREKILNHVWNYDYYGDSRTIDSHIKKIRHKLGKRGRNIKTIRGVGYKFETKSN